MKRISQKAIAMYRAFRGHKPRGVKALRIKWPTELVELAKAHSIVYVSNKLNGGGNGKEYPPWVHKFGPGVKMYTNPEGTMLILKGGQMIVRQEGIIN